MFSPGNLPSQLGDGETAAEKEGAELSVSGARARLSRRIFNFIDRIVLGY